MAKPLEAVTAITVVLSVKGNTIDFDPKLFGFMDKKDGIIIWFCWKCTQRESMMAFL